MEYNRIKEITLNGIEIKLENLDKGNTKGVQWQTIVQKESELDFCNDFEQ